MVRGVEKRLLFLDDEDRSLLHERLTERLIDDQVTCFAWAFMPNHLHLVVQTGPVPISKVMQRVFTSYSLRFNRRHDRVGHLVQNRFKSIPVSDDEYLLRLIRYVHRNPLAGGVVDSIHSLSGYPWSGYPALMGTRAPVFEAVEPVLALFDQDCNEARRRIDAWMQCDDEPASEDRPPPPPRTLDTQTNSSESASRERANDSGNSRRTSLDELVRATCAGLGVAPEHLLRGRRDRRTTTARSLIAHRAITELHLSGVEIARALRISPGAVVRAARRGRDDGSYAIPRRPVCQLLKDRPRSS